MLYHGFALEHNAADCISVELSLAGPGVTEEEVRGHPPPPPRCGCLPGYRRPPARPLCVFGYPVSLD
jgi:hypothetical protein